MRKEEREEGKSAEKQRMDNGSMAANVTDTCHFL